MTVRRFFGGPFRLFGVLVAWQWGLECGGGREGRRRCVSGQRADLTTGEGERLSDLRIVLDGLLVGATNPKGLVFFAAVLAQFVKHDAENIPLQMMVLGLIPAGIGLVCDTVWGLGASEARTWFAGPDRRLSMIGGAGGIALLGLELAVATTRH